MMKNILILAICFNMLVTPSFAMIKDDLVESTLDKTKPYPTRVIVNINDDFAEDTLEHVKTQSRQKVFVVDSFAESNKSKNPTIIKAAVLEEILPKKSSNIVVIKNKDIVTDKTELVSLELKIKNRLASSDSNIDEGDYVEFETTKAVSYKSKTYPAGTIVKARIENISPNGMRGVPGDIILGHFSIGNTNLIGEISKTGSNRSVWVYPVATVGSAFFGLGLLFLLVKGGSAELKTTQVYKVYFPR